MKTNSSSRPESQSGQKYWRSLDQLADTPEFRQWVDREFPEGASEFTDPVSRRYFVKIMSASFLLAGIGLTGCRRPEEHILPFSKMPEDYVHGMPQFFATSMPTRGSAIPLVAKAYEGRPVKVEGNAAHPDSNGGTDAFAQASLLNLYDVDRATRFTENGKGVSREVALDFLGKVSQQAAAKKGAGLCFLLERSSSPSRQRLHKLIAAKFPQAKWFIYEPVDFDISRQAATAAFGQSVRPYYKLDEAKAIVSLDCDFIGGEEDTYLNIRRFVKGRKTKSNRDEMSRLYVVEALMTLTGATADHRLRVSASAVQAVAAKLALEVLAKTGRSGAISGLEALAAGAKVDEKWISACADDLVAHGKEAVVMAGHRQPLAVHMIATALNAALGSTKLGSVGQAVEYLPAEEPVKGTISELVAELNAGSVSTLVILGGNPVYNAPADLKWSQAQKQAGTVIRLGYTEDESFPEKGWHLPLAHYLESWGDARTADGTLVPVQPLIQPLFGGVTELEVLARIGGLSETNPYDIVRTTFAAITKGGENDWRKFLHDGFAEGTAAKSAIVKLKASVVSNAVAAAKALPTPGNNALEVVFHRSYSLDDGRYANNGWLQELPDPITRVSWDNAITVSPNTAKELGLKGVDKWFDFNRTSTADAGQFHNQVANLTVNGVTLSGPVWILPGMADNVVAIELGYGRPKAGRVARSQKGEAAGFDAYVGRTASAMHIASGAKLVGTDKIYDIACVQEHSAMEGRPIIREANLEHYKKHPDFAKEMNLHEAPVTKSLYPNPLDPWKDKALHQWGMAIDLSSCVGCTACMVACQSENNVPIVGKDQVRRGREMHWLRLDRYFSGNYTDPQVVFQPMMCQHCEAAPCENVCPVNATAHSEEGLNVMAYNRCVGTRYCSNNCPYKVRRFNYLDYNKRGLEDLVGPFYKTPLLSSKDGEWNVSRWYKSPESGLRPDDEWELLKLAKNPDVSVRMRGVMEKCSLCVQRIEHAKIAQKVKARDTDDVVVPDGTFKTACQQACPADAISFGNLKDPNSEVSQWKNSDRNYSVLEFLLTKPRTTYLARLRNPNMEMPKDDPYLEEPGTTKEFEHWEHEGNRLDSGIIKDESESHAAAGKKGAE